MQKRIFNSTANICILTSLLLIGSNIAIFIKQAKAETACVRTKRGAIVCGEVVSKDNNTNSSNQVKSNNLVFDLQNCLRDRDTIQCDFLVTNNGDDTTISISSAVIMRSPPKIVAANTGEEFKSNRIKFGTSESDNVSNILVQGVPTKLTIIFSQVPNQVNALTLLEIPYTNNKDSEYKVRFRGVAISTQ